MAIEYAVWRTPRLSVLAQARANPPPGLAPVPRARPRPTK